MDTNQRIPVSDAELEQLIDDLVGPEADPADLFVGSQVTLCTNDRNAILRLVDTLISINHPTHASKRRRIRKAQRYSGRDHDQ